MSQTETGTFSKGKGRKRVAQAAAEEAVREIETDETGFGLEDEPTLSMEENASIDESDILTDMPKELAKANDFPSYTIYKNGALLTTRKGTLTWDIIRKEYGPGSYKIICRSNKTGRIVKVQTQELGDIPGTEKQGPEFAFAGQNFSNEPKAPGFMEIFLLKAEMEEKNRIRQQELEAKMEVKQKEVEARLAETEKAKESSSTELFKIMMQMQQTSSQQMQTMMMENQKLMMTLMTQKPRDEGLKAHELAKMLADAEKNGYSRWKDIADMIDKKAEKKAEEMAESKGDGDESLTKTLIKGFMPMISQAVQNAGTPGQLPAGQRQPTPEEIAFHNRQVEYQRVQEENKRVAQANARRQAQARPPQRPVQATAQTPRPTESIVVKPTQGHSPKLTNGHLKEHIQSLVIPVLAEDLGNQLAPDVSAERCMRVIEAQGLTQKDVLDNYKRQDIIGLVDSFIEPEKAPEAKVWFNSFYTFIERRGMKRADMEVTPGGKVEREIHPESNPSQTL